MASTRSNKRLRSEVDDEGDESLPISKRINGLHIQNERSSYLNQEDQLSPLIHPSNMNGHTESWQQQASQQPNHHAHLSPLSVSAEHSRHLETNLNNNIENRQSSSSSVLLNPDLLGYEPELTVTENPHYFHINEVLYRAHVDRATRTNQFFDS
ncbi:uncharacterized protein LOC126811331 [Patella vulgata]|uniref:uncharacterized protein LOC126811331 n=1 Tax=Patella vulgata TaxID=6465 RepID=UPI00217F7EAF|nr:uncharacterized protein LOC126811331 [Patella vulgata]